MASAAKNTALMTVASVGQKIISFAYFTLIARMIGVESTGQYFFALSFTTVFVVFVDLGFTQVLIRELSKTKQKIQQFFSSILTVKIIFGILTYIALFISINLLGYETEVKQLVYLSGITMLFDSLHLTLYGVIRALGDLRYEAAGIIGSQLLTLVLGGYFLVTGKPLIFLILAFTIPSALNACYVLYILVTRYSVNLRLKFDKQFLIKTTKIAAPFAVAGIFARVYSYVDSIILSKLAGDIAVGLYSIPYKITYAFQFVPLALVAALYPKFSEFFAHNKQKLAKTFEQSLVYLFIVVMPIVVGISVLSSDIILTIYSDQYIESILPLKILLFGLIFSYISFPIGAFLNACSRQVTQTIIVGVVMTTNIILNLLLIPKIGIYGAAISAAAGNILLTALSYSIVPSITKIRHLFLLKKSIQIIIAAIIMGISVYYTNLYSHFIIAILVGAVIYPVALFITRAISIKQMQEVVYLVKK